MGKATYEGVGVPVEGDLHDCLLTNDIYRPRVGLAKLLEEAGADVCFGAVYEALCREGTPNACEWHSTVAQEHLRDNGGEMPPVYRVRVTVEVEKVSDEDARQYWTAKKGGAC